MKILIDTREQHPFSFSDPLYKGIAVEKRGLQTGDYSIAGLEHQVAVERKSLEDLIRSISWDRDRFKRELQRAKELDAFMIVVEAPFYDITHGNYRSKMLPKSATQTIYSFMAHNIPIHFAGNRQWAEYATYNFLRHYARHVEKGYKSVFPWPKDIKKTQTLDIRG